MFRGFRKALVIACAAGAFYPTNRQVTHTTSGENEAAGALRDATDKWPMANSSNSHGQPLRAAVQAAPEARQGRAAALQHS